MTVLNTVASNEPAIILADVFNDIRKNSDKSDKLSSTLIRGMFAMEATFSREMLEHYFKAKPADRGDMRKRMIAEHDDAFKADLAWLASQKDLDKKERDHDKIEKIGRQHKSMTNTFELALKAVYFCRVGGEFVGQSEPIGSVSKLSDKAGNFIIYYRDPEGDSVKLQGHYSSRALQMAGDKAVNKLLEKKTKPKTETTSVNASPVGMVHSSVKTFNAMIDQALNETTTAMKAEGVNIERAGLDELPDEIVADIDQTLARLIVLKFAHEGHIDAVDVTAWIADNVKAAKLDGVKQVRPLRKTA